jgi:hypothetical protein
MRLMTAPFSNVSMCMLALDGQHEQRNRSHDCLRDTGFCIDTGILISASIKVAAALHALISSIVV